MKPKVKTIHWSNEYILITSFSSDTKLEICGFQVKSNSKVMVCFYGWLTNVQRSALKIAPFKYKTS